MEKTNIYDATMARSADVRNKVEGNLRGTPTFVETRVLEFGNRTQVTGDLYGGLIETVSISFESDYSDCAICSTWFSTLYSGDDLEPVFTSPFAKRISHNKRKLGYDEDIAGFDTSGHDWDDNVVGPGVGVLPLKFVKKVDSVSAELFVASQKGFKAREDYYYSGDGPGIIEDNPVLYEAFFFNFLEGSRFGDSVLFYIPAGLLSQYQIVVKQDPVSNQLLVEEHIWMEFPEASMSFGKELSDICTNSNCPVDYSPVLNCDFFINWRTIFTPTMQDSWLPCNQYFREITGQMPDSILTGEDGA
eukprot:TRINITY_DN13132_c0_g1_i1.p1 TRINITY_DN13132_c0_g1~~TRINITY_DN13132_c0_g1_i1.p1  ORF type:complete len:347 (-),score=45.30 TRINITY_DN13132_c0_g1_i1:88-996(-)